MTATMFWHIEFRGNPCGWAVGTDRDAVMTEARLQLQARGYRFRGDDRLTVTESVGPHDARDLGPDRVVIEIPAAE